MLENRNVLNPPKKKVSQKVQWTTEKPPKSFDFSGLTLVGEDGFEPSKRNAADLQSVPFGHSGTPPYEILLSLRAAWSR